MTLLQQFIKYCKQEIKLDITNTSLLIAVSGGVDSVVLVDLCHQAGFQFIIAHCNFNLRGEESIRDENFVRSLGETYQREVLVKSFDTKQYAEANRLSIQVAARELRYNWFEEIIRNKVEGLRCKEEDERLKVNSGRYKVEAGLDNVELITTSLDLRPSTLNLKPSACSLFQLATAHHADDNIETLLLNFFRGTGISGLHGILPRQGNIIRPLLFAKREEIVAYATKQNLLWVEDSSNSSAKYSRNFVRHQVVPMMKTIYPQVDDNLLGNIERFKEIELIYNESIEKIKAKLIEVKGNEFHIPILKLNKQTPLKTIVYELIRDFGFAATETDEVIKLLDATNGSYRASTTHRLIINRNWLIIAPLQSEEAMHILIEKEMESIAFANGKLSFKESIVNNHLNVETAFTNNSSIATLNADEIKWPLILRPFKQGDYFYPLGMLKKKKLSKFFIDLKLSKTDKERVWVIESDKRIVWVVGYRIDNRFKVKPSTQKQVAIQLEGK